jgi:hypothetical protein
MTVDEARRIALVSLESLALAGTALATDPARVARTESIIPPAPAILPG